MDDLDAVAPAFVEMAQRIVCCLVATVDADARPWTRVLHPLREYCEPSHDTCSAACRAEWIDPGERALWLPPWRLRVMQGTAMLAGRGRVLTWSEPTA